MQQNFSFHDVPNAIHIFQLFSVFSICFPKVDFVDDVIFLVVEKLLYFIENLTETDYENLRPLSNQMLHNTIIGANDSLHQRILERIISDLDRFPPHGIADLVSVFDETADSYFKEKALQAQNAKEIALLYGVIKNNSSFFVDNKEKITDILMKGSRSSVKEDYQMTVLTSKRLLSSLLSTKPVQKRLELSGFVNNSDIKISWIYPSENEIQAADHFCQKMISDLIDQFNQSDSSRKPKIINFLFSIIFWNSITSFKYAFHG